MSTHPGQMPRDWVFLYRQPKIVEVDGVRYVRAAEHRASVEEIAQHSYDSMQMFAEAMVMLDAARAELRSLKGDL